MHRQAVSSSNLHSVGYDESTNVLEIEFNGGGIYQYYNVPPAVYKGLMNASSHGKYFHVHIKGIYQYTKVR